jgi:hypothetical protein
VRFDSLLEHGALLVVHGGYHRTRGLLRNRCVDRTW